jgi:hypothetical protein
MGTSDTILQRKTHTCPSCNREYVHYQYLALDDSHFTAEGNYPCPCAYSLEEKRDIASLRNNGFIESSIPKMNLEIILAEIMEKDNKLPDWGYRPKHISNVYKLDEVNRKKQAIK